MVKILPLKYLRLIVTNTNEDEIIAICNKKEVKLLNNEISKISYNISSVLNKYYNVDPIIN